MKLALSTLIVPLLITVGMSAPTPMPKSTMSTSTPVPRQLQGGTLPEALSNAGGISGFLKSLKLPLAGDALGQ
ncbi:hypothetical protein BJX68DRAFT_272564 [Aspergillus pseudodeflectus]|uniref:Uncharacterized protein n=1 Tax=Aspergillus pseudodeflectus TaxID=176178 RepID=A0ABR4JEM0_9EURO